MKPIIHTANLWHQILPIQLLASHCCALPTGPQWSTSLVIPESWLATGWHRVWGSRFQRYKLMALHCWKVEQANKNTSQKFIMGGCQTLETLGVRISIGDFLTTHRMPHGSTVVKVFLPPALCRLVRPRFAWPGLNLRADARRWQRGQMWATSTGMYQEKDPEIRSHKLLSIHRKEGGYNSSQLKIPGRSRRVQRNPSEEGDIQHRKNCS